MGRIKYCSECSSPNDSSNNYCIVCGHKLKKVEGKENKKYCISCGERLNIDMDYCGVCGKKVKTNGKLKICSVCGEWYDTREGYYCSNCGHNTIKRCVELVAHREGNIFKLLSTKLTEKDKIETIRTKICQNCNTKHQRFFSYCEECGTKLVKK